MPTITPDPLLLVHGITVGYTNWYHRFIPVVTNCSFSLYQGEIVGLIGHNGSGKTTIVQAIAQIIPVHAGTITHDPQPIGYLPDKKATPSFLSVYECFRYLALLHNFTSTALDQRYHELSTQLILEPYSNHPLSTLSKGTLQRVYLAYALINKPRIIILDEPFAGLDPFSLNIITDIIRQEQMRGNAILITGHAPSTLYDRYIQLV